MARFVLVFSVWLFVAMLASDPASSQQALQLWNTRTVNCGACSSFAKAWGVEAFSPVIRGYSYPHSRGVVEEFIERTVQHLNAAAIGRANDPALRDRLLAAAQNKAFLKLDFGASGGASPSFLQAVMVETVAYAVSYLRGRNALDPAQLKVIDGWGCALLKGAATKAGSRDHKAILASASVAWGAAVGDAGLFNSGAAKLKTIVSGVKGNKGFAPDIRNANEVMHHVIGGAHILRLNGRDLFSDNLHSAVAAHAKAVTELGTAKVKTSGDPADQARSILRAQGFGTHVAWVPVYLANFPSGGASAEVRALDKRVRQSDRSAYWGMQMGIHTGCLMGRR